jgi:hypothetical protein
VLWPLAGSAYGLVYRNWTSLSRTWRGSLEVLGVLGRQRRGLGFVVTRFIGSFGPADRINAVPSNRFHGALGRRWGVLCILEVDAPVDALCDFPRPSARGASFGLPVTLLGRGGWRWGPRNRGSISDVQCLGGSLGVAPPDLPVSLAPPTQHSARFGTFGAASDAPRRPILGGSGSGRG